jgi:hypothetical protein
MTTRARISRLRELIVELEQLPAEPARDALLTEARTRVVAAETGDSPSRRWSTVSRGPLKIGRGGRAADREREQGALARQLVRSPFSPV